jgi:aryl-alcohol dehydrogenase-like predicted oxidoreductase
MKTRKLGTSELQVTELILGTWAIGGSMWSDYDEAGAKEAIKTAIDCGINCIDTAPAYGAGHAEELIGEIVKGVREQLIIATKCGLNIEGRYEKILTPEFIMHDLEMSLKRLKMDYVDLYQIHWPVNDVPIEVSMEALMKAKQQGKVRYLGVCNFSGKELEAAIKCGEVVSLQPNYSLLERDIEKDSMPVCKTYGVSIISYGSIAAGMLTGKYKEHPTFKKGDARNFFYRYFKKEYWPAVKRVVDEVEAIAKKYSARPHHVALAWILSHDVVAGAIFGARNGEQVKDNLAGAEIKLSKDDIEKLNHISENIYS